MVKLGVQSALPVASGRECTHATRATVRRSWALPVMALTLVVIVVLALSAGRYAVPFNETARIVLGQFIPLRETWTPMEEQVVLGTRLPRAVLAMLIGGGLALGGAALQAVFRNPLVSPQGVGVSNGAAFGGVLILLIGGGYGALVTSAFVWGLIALVAVVHIGGGRGFSSILKIVLGGIVVGAFFAALVSVATYLADPYTTLPTIVFWLMGSLSTASWTSVLVGIGPIAVGSVVLLGLRWRANVLSLGDEDAKSLGIDVHRLRILVLAMVALVTAGAVAVAGVIGWVGLVVPHIARLIVGPDHRVQFPASVLIGAAYLLLIDTLSRSITQAELPVGILTAIIGAPVFVVLLRSAANRSLLER